MFLHWKPSKYRREGFTLIEVLISFVVFSMVISGLVYGYVQVNRMAEFSSMSLAAQSYASQGLEQAKSAQWDYVRWPNTNYGSGTGDELGFPPSMTTTNLTPVVDILDVPTTGNPIFITNFVSITYVLTSINPSNPPMRQIRSDVVWAYPWNGTTATNTAIELRAPDQ
jgi:prepilin-type N-terminal cleavage/methylation domain-containing protein